MMSEPGNYEGIDTVVLNDELACHDVLPVSWQALDTLPAPFRLAGIDESNTLLLQACVAMEEHPMRDKNEELGPLAAELARLDFKLNVVLQLLGRLVTRDQSVPAVNVTFNAQGASWTPAGPLPGIERGKLGLLRIQLRSSLPQPLEIPAEVLAVQQDEVKVAFVHVAESATELLQRLAFLRHRRYVAEARKSRGR
ncbi:MAG TPA: PilZ domain-containing protein [Steroidobacteraceae bacterium]|nr:PilZ domain-containing protein [Steroidobacteraceae bacterium]